MTFRFITIFLSMFLQILAYANISPKMYFSTASDTEHFTCLMNLIGSIHKLHFDETEQIAVFDLGLTNEQQEKLKKIEKVVLYQIELTHPDLLKKFIVRPNGRMARGWYGWKPVVIKQSLDMFPYILYVDAGMTITNSLQTLFKHIIQNGHFFYSTEHNIKITTTKFVIDNLQLHDPTRTFILHDSTTGLSAGFQGLSRARYSDYVIPIYELTKDIRYFVDDGTSPWGFGTGRHDQTLFSIQARLLGLKINSIARSTDFLLVDNKKIPFCVDTVLKQKREGSPETGYIQFVKFKGTNNA